MVEKTLDMVRHGIMFSGPLIPGLIHTTQVKEWLSPTSPMIKITTPLCQFPNP